MYQLFCDSNCELWHTKVKDFGLNVIRMPYLLDDKEYFYDMGENTDLKAFFDKMRAGSVPKTQALNEYDYTQYFEPVLARGEDIYYITFSHQMSGTFNSMKAAIAALKEKYPEREIRYKDTKMISMGSGFVVYYGAQKYKEGASMDELDAYLDELISQTAMYFVVDDLTYLYRGGRISGTSKVIGNMLGIKPVLSYSEDGKIVNIDKIKGKKRALLKLLDFMKEQGCELDKYTTYVVDADSREEADVFAGQIKNAFGNIDIEMQTIGPVIGSHCGPGTVGLIFHSQKK